MLFAKFTLSFFVLFCLARPPSNLNLVWLPVAMGRKGKAGKGKGRVGHGGMRQQLQREAAEIDDLVETRTGSDGHQSQLAIALLYLWSLGTISPQMVQFLANLAVKDIRTLNTRNAVRLDCDLDEFEEFNDLLDMSKIGTSGLHGNNCNADLCRLFPNPLERALKATSMPIKAINAIGYITKEITFVWPHLLFSLMYHQFRDHWNRFVCPGQAALQKFWADIRSTGHPQLSLPDILNRADLDDRCIPLFLHADGTPVTAVGKAGQSMMDTFSWGSSLVWGKTADSLFFILSIIVRSFSKVLGMQTDKHVARKLAFSFDCIWKGEFPSHDEFGVPYRQVLRCHLPVCICEYATLVRKAMPAYLFRTSVAC